MRHLTLASLAVLASTRLFAAEIEMFAPQGAVTQVRQVKARFSAPMVVFGEPRLPAPFEVSCPEKGSGRWIDERTWVYDFERDVPPAVSCHFKLKAGLKTLAGEVVNTPAPAAEGEAAGVARVSTLSFSTGGPEVIQHWPQTYTAIDENQAFVLRFGARPTAASLQQKAGCLVEGVGERMPIKILTGSERERILSAVFGKNGRPDNLEVVRCQRTLPNGVGTTLLLDAGLATANGATSAQPNKLEFRVREQFTLTQYCERSNSKAGCIPISDLRLRFSSPVPWAQAQKIALTTADGKTRFKPRRDEEEPDAKSVDGIRFAPPFPESAVLKLTVPPDLRDEEGRKLENAKSFPLSIKMDAYPPLAKFAANFGIIERNAGAYLPVTVRNVRPDPAAEKPKQERSLLGTLADAIGSSNKAPAAPAGLPYRILTLTSDADMIAWFKRAQRGPEQPKEGTPGVTVDARSWSLLSNQPLAKPYQLPVPADDKPAEVIGVPLPSSGLHVVEVESRRLGDRLLEPTASMYVSAAALVTNLGIHFKEGQDNALVWVTTLDKGWLVNGATVAVYDCNGKPLASGKTDKTGLFQIGKSLARKDCNRFIIARVGDDMALASSDWDNGIEPWRFNLNTAYQYGNQDNRLLFHSIFDRSLLRPGETISMKHVGRRQSMLGFDLLGDNQQPNQMALVHEGSGERVTVPLNWTRSASEAKWKIPKEAKLGRYDVVLERTKATGKKEPQIEASYHAGSFTVGEFRVPLLKGFVKPATSPLIDASEANLALQLSYLSGGAASGEPVVLRGVVRSRYLDFDGWDGFTFSNGDLPPDVLSGASKTRTENEEGSEGVESGEAGPQDQLLETQKLVLDKNGAAVGKLVGITKQPYPTELLAEMEYRDPNGERRTTSTLVPLWPSANVTGVLVDAERKSGDAMPIKLAVADFAGKPKPGESVELYAYRRKVISTRKRMLGGFYSYDHQTSYQVLGKVCSGKTDSKGVLACSFASKESGDILLRAVSRDAQGRQSVAHTEYSVYAGGESWNEVGNTDRIDVIPDKKQYEPGQVAKLQVRMPFREASALVTVEREGVIDSFTTTLKANSPIVQVPIKGHYAPNAFISVFVVRGRVGDVQPTAMVDMGRPAFKLGIAEVQVGGRANQLDVKLTADQPVYETRAKAKVKVQVKTVDGRPLPKGGEVAFAAVDEGLLQLMPNESWKLFDAMMAKRPYAVKTATAQMEIIGKRHFGKKALPPGGGGGRSSTRELFDTLLKWQGRVVLDDKGMAEIEVPLNDSLTAFRLVAIATAGSDRFGTGETKIRSNKDVMVLPGLAPLVREGDKLDALFTVRNTTAKPVSLTVSAKVTVRGAANFTPEPQTVELPANGAREIAFAYEVPFNASNLSWQVEVLGADGKRFDSLKLGQAVSAAVPVRVWQANLSQLDGESSLKVERPADALPGRGEVRIGLSPSLVNIGLEGVDRYMRNYPYVCLEQKTSKAIALRDKDLWIDITRRLPIYIDDDGLATYFPRTGRGSDTLTAYFLSIAAEAGWEIPNDSKERLLAGLTAFAEGRLERKLYEWDLRSRSARQLAAVAALARHGAARPKLLESIVIEPNRWQTGAVLDWLAILQYSKDWPNRANLIKAAEQVLWGRLDLSGTVARFSTERDDYWWWLMQSPDANAVQALLYAVNSDSFKADAGKLARGALARQREGHWNTTLANVWGVVAMDRFAKVFEKVPVAGVTSASLGGKSDNLNWTNKPEGGSLVLPWPDKPGALAVSHQGAGKPWAMVQSRVAMQLKEPFSAGFSVKKTITAVEAAGTGYSRGDVWRVKLDFTAQADMTWVVVNDPIPAGATLLNRGYGGDSAILGAAETRTGAWPTFEERAFDGYRAYYEYLPKGSHSIEYTVRLNNRGNFNLPPTRIEAMYSPETFGENPNPNWQVK
ncbi:alpha-2-macroglobulin family protein [Parachitinimonas caeni]|uniref:MG2 domain-containing protein n=1 Tax=Parachitinimonas caeni TaxID=3031301 RepID=A0ABT7DWQ2_9NEIS|nr:MG2 domain-containing protein [Parachitinimonas caeni]MDK2123595.1 MG2 domain-containing protein [Parachitinimonas caeni]